MAAVTCCKPGCDRAAEWLIWFQPDPHDASEACTEHVGALLDAEKAHEITRLYLDGEPAR